MIKVRLDVCPESRYESSHHTSGCLLCSGTSRVLRLFPKNGVEMYFSTTTGKVTLYTPTRGFMTLGDVTERVRLSGGGQLPVFTEELLDYLFFHDGYLNNEVMSQRVHDAIFKIHTDAFFTRRALQEWGMFEPLLGDNDTWHFLMRAYGTPSTFVKRGVEFPIKPNMVIQYSYDNYIINYYLTYYKDGMTHLDLTKPLDPVVALNLMRYSKPIRLGTLHKVYK